jgi:hypothetical protein
MTTCLGAISEQMHQFQVVAQVGGCGAVRILHHGRESLKRHIVRVQRQYRHARLHQTAQHKLLRFPMDEYKVRVCE